MKTSCATSDGTARRSITPTLAHPAREVAEFCRHNEGKQRIGDTVIATVTDTLKSLFTDFDLHFAETADAETDLVIDELDQWRNPERTLAGACTQTFNLVVVPQGAAASRT